MDNKEKLLACALELFYEKGYDAVGVQEIVDQAGITKPTLYYYFGSKKGLLESLLHQYFDPFEQKLREAADYQGNVPDTLYRVARTFFNNVTQEPKFYLLMLALFFSGRKSDGFQMVYPFLVRYYNLFVEIFENASPQLGNMHGRQEQFAVGFIGSLNFYIMAAAKNNDITDLVVTDKKTYDIVHQFMYGIYS